jgi:hypothetical protein
MRNGSARGRGMSGNEDSSGGDRGTARGPEQYPDLETELEQEMSASGRTGVVPRTGLVGAHQQRHASLAASVELDEPGEPAGPGAEVAPTRQAEQREAERHRRERELGVIAAGDENLRQRRSPDVTRQALDESAAEVDRQAVGRRAEAALSSADQAGWQQRAGHWLRSNRTAVVGISGAAMAAACFLVVSRRR